MGQAHGWALQAQIEMLTKVILEGPLGEKFGREWNLRVKSPAEALDMIEVNVGGIRKWIRDNLETYKMYRVVCEYHDGRIEHLDNETFKLDRRLKSVSFAPVISGAGGGTMKMVLGAVLIAASFIVPGGSPFLLKMGASMMLSGAISALMAPPDAKQRVDDRQQVENGTSYYFNGPVNTVTQGVPVQLIYGRVKVGSHAISAFVNVDQLL